MEAERVEETQVTIKATEPQPQPSIKATEPQPQPSIKATDPQDESDLSIKATEFDSFEPTEIHSVSHFNEATVFATSCP